MRERQDKASRGFTLIEILLVVAILGILVTIAAVKTTGHMDNTRRQATWITIRNIKLAIAQFEMAVGRLPKDLEELLIEGDDDWPGPFWEEEKLPKDGWGNDLHYEIKKKRVRVTSPGADGQLGTDDDLWK